MLYFYNAWSNYSYVYSGLPYSLHLIFILSKLNSNLLTSIAAPNTWGSPLNISIILPLSSIGIGNWGLEFSSCYILCPLRFYTDLKADIYCNLFSFIMFLYLVFYTLKDILPPSIKFFHIPSSCYKEYSYPSQSHPPITSPPSFICVTSSLFLTYNIY